MGTLIESISGVRGIWGAGLDALVVVRYALGYGQWCLQRALDRPPRIVIGRDARSSGPLCASLFADSLRSLGLDVVDAGLAPTPTVAMAVLLECARGGVVLSASHNPEEWNALKLLNETSEFLSPEQGAEVMALARASEAPNHPGTAIGRYSRQNYLDRHIDAIFDLEYCDLDAVAQRRFSVVVDGINSVGGVALPRLLERMGVEHIHVVNRELTGRFAHPAEPLPENLTGTMDVVRKAGVDLGLVVDPDADRLALIDDKGEYVSEELTQVIAADFLWRKRSGPFATNLSSSRAIDDVAARYRMSVHRSAVGEINVVRTMQQHNAILGGEGNGGVIVPDLHYGRDALVGAAMVLQHLAELDMPLSAYRKTLPAYSISKNKLVVADPEAILKSFAAQYADQDISTVDGVKVNFAHGWVHVRKSNTEPIVRIYAEAKTETDANKLARECIAGLRQFT